MRAKEFTNKLDESLDKPYPLTWNYDKEAQGEISAETVLDDGTPFIMAFYSKTTPGEYTVAFSRNYEVGTTDLGLEFRVFATALDGIKTFIKKRWPISIKFITVKEEDPLGKRDKLYKSIIRRNADTLGYHLEISDQQHVVVYYFKRINVGSKKQGVAESASGYIPSNAEKNDPRFKTALTVDIKPDTMKKDAKKFGNKISRAGIPPTLKANGKF